jgi:hypothetical protein
VILPTKTEEIRLNLRDPAPPPRPVNALVIKQTLSPEAPRGQRLRLEIKAEGFGALPEKIGDLLDIGKLHCKDEVAPLSGSGFDAKTGRAKVERMWSLNLPRAGSLHAGQFDYPGLRSGWMLSAPVSYLYRDPNQDLEVAGSPVVVEAVSWWVATLAPLAGAAALLTVLAVVGWVLVRRFWPRPTEEGLELSVSSVTSQVVTLLLYLARDEGPLSESVRNSVRNALAPFEEQAGPRQDSLPANAAASSAGAADVESARVVACLVDLVARHSLELPACLKPTLNALLPQIEDDCFAPG